MHEVRTGLKKRISRIAKIVLALSMCLIMPMAAITVSAAENEVPDLDREGSLSITFTYYNETDGKTYPVTNGNSVGLYKIADVVADKGYKFVVRDKFSSIGEIPETSEELDKANIDLAEKLAAIAGSYDFDVAPKEMDENGTVLFKGLEVGLYLVMQASEGKTDDDQFVIAPFLITIPMRNADGSLSYDVDADAKPVGIAKIETPTPTPTPTGVPQTGQLWWPVMALGVIGALFIVAGLVRKLKN